MNDFMIYGYLRVSSDEGVSGGKDPETVHCVNSFPAGLYVEETTCDHPEMATCDGCPRYIEDDGVCDLEL